MGLAEFFKDKCVLVTGGCGTIGKALVRQLAAQRPREIRVVDNSEDGVFGLQQEYRDHSCVNVVIGDVRDEHRLNETSEGVEYVFHTAALKHVEICERSPTDAVMTNIIGAQNVIRAALRAGVRTCLFTSTDKAVNPTNVMGTSKLMAERLVTAANNYSAPGRTVFSSTRFGNVLGSRGSVLRVFSEQIRVGKPLTLTDAGMTRFITTIQESVRLMLAAARLAKGGELFIPKMPKIRIMDLASTMIRVLAPRYGRDPDSVRIEIVGKRLGEKLHEELMTDEEATRAKELQDLFAVLPAAGSLRHEIRYEYGGRVFEPDRRSYDTRSGPYLSDEQIAKFLELPGVLNDSGLEETPGPDW